MDKHANKIACMKDEEDSNSNNVLFVMDGLEHWVDLNVKLEENLEKESSNEDLSVDSKQKIKIEDALAIDTGESILQEEYVDQFLVAEELNCSLCEFTTKIKSALINHKNLESDLYASVSRKRDISDDAIQALIYDSGSNDLSSDDEEEIFGNSSSSDEVSEVDELSDQVCDLIGPQKWTNVCISEENTNLISLQGVTQAFSGSHQIIGFQDLSPFQCFQKFFPEDIYRITANETNSYAKKTIEGKLPLPPTSRFRKWSDVSESDIKAFVALEILMGMIHKPTLQSYYNQKFYLTSTPGFGSVMPRDQYFLIRSFLHFCKNENVDKEDRLYKIRPIIDLVKGLYTQHYTSNRELSVDETMAKFKGRLFFQQYLPSKPSSNRRIKLWSLCDSHTGYLLRFNVCVGKEAEPTSEKDLAHKVVTSLLSGFEEKGHIIYLDNFNSSVDLYEDLKSKQIGACGTVRANRKGLPSEMKNIKMKKGDLPKIWINENKSLIATSWQDTGKVNMISNVGNTGISPLEVNSRKGTKVVYKSNIQLSYNQFMGGVDRFDQLCSTYPFNRKSKKWYQALWHFIIEVALVNSYICYNIQNPSKTLLPEKFREVVVRGMLEGYVTRGKPNKRNRISEDSPMANRLVQRHFPSFNEQKATKPNCVVCSILPNKCAKKGKGECKRKQTSYICAQCYGKPALCVVPCFELYHTKNAYKKVCRCGETDN